MNRKSMSLKTDAGPANGRRVTALTKGRIDQSQSPTLCIGRDDVPVGAPLHGAAGVDSKKIAAACSGLKTTVAVLGGQVAAAPARA